MKHNFTKKLDLIYMVMMMTGMTMMSMMILRM